MAMEFEEVEIEKALHVLLDESDLLLFEEALVFVAQLTRLEHFDYVRDDELSLYGLSLPAIRRLRNAIEKQKKLIKKGKISKEDLNKKIKISKKQLSSLNDFKELSSSRLIPKDELMLMEKLGEGTFAVVKRAIWKQPNGRKFDTAVKILRNMTSDLKAETIAEISSMQHLKHFNLVQFFGVTFNTDQILMVLEFCEGGSLLNRLRNRTKEKLLVTTLLKYSQQIANGMAYLESRRFVHRDLAARNILLTQNDEVLKICDFGLTRSLGENERLYVMSGQKKVPFAWCPPESLRFRHFSDKSDVWAYGVTLWEIFTFGEDPWAGLDAVKVLQIIESGQRLKHPEFSSKELYDIVTMCWNSSPELRPKFSQLRKILHDLKFMIVACRSESVVEDSTKLDFLKDDKIIVIRECINDEWYGQNMRTKMFGKFSRSAIAVETPEPDPVVVSRVSYNCDNGDSYKDNLFQTKTISCPLKGSFVHTGHGDIDENKCWGDIGKIDEIYLKNPIIGSTCEIQMKLPESVNFVPFVHNNVDSSLVREEKEEKKVSSSRDQSSFNPFLSPKAADKLLGGIEEAWNSNSLPIVNKLQSEAKSTSFIQKPPGRYTRSAESSPTVHLEQLSAEETFSSIFCPNHTVLPPPPSKDCISRHFVERKISNSSSHSKYDSTISIPRPNRSSLNLGNYTKASKCVTPPPSIFFTQTTSSDSPQPFSLALLSEPSHNIPEFSNSIVPDVKKSIQENVISSSTDQYDPFELNDKVKTITKKLRYHDVHKLVSTSKCEQKSQTSQSPTNSQILSPESNHAQIEKNLFDSSKFLQFTTSSISHNQAPIVNFSTEVKKPETSKYASLLPPPSNLLLYGSSGSKIDKSHNNVLNQRNSYLLFDLSSHSPSKSTTQTPRIRIGSNGIPILDPIRQFISYTSDVSSSEQKPKASPIDLSDLDPNVLVRRVLKEADFASIEECRQILKKSDYDVDKAIKNLKIEKLLELGLVSDKDLAASALDTYQWDINATANRLVSNFTTQILITHASNYATILLFLFQ